MKLQSIATIRIFNFKSYLTRIGLTHPKNYFFPASLLCLYPYKK